MNIWYNNSNGCTKSCTIFLSKHFSFLP